MTDPIVFLIALASSSCFTILFSVYLLRIGCRGILGRPFPLTREKNITGWPARLAGIFMATIGVIFLAFGIVTIPLCLWRTWHLFWE